MATLVGEAAVRIVPSVRNFKSRTESELKALAIKAVAVQVTPELAKAEAEMDAWRAAQQRRSVDIPVKVDAKGLERSFSQVEHVFKRKALSRAFRLNIVIAGLDALPALAYAAGSAASGLDALGKSAFALPGIMGGALSSVGALAIGLRNVSDAFKAYTKDSDNAAQNAREQSDNNRSLARSYRDYRDAVKDTIREIQDLNAENRRSSLNVADAVLSVQEAADRIRKGGQKSITELQRDQLSYLQAIDHLQEVQRKAQRTAQDTVEANAKGIAGSDKVMDALDTIAKNTEKVNAGNITKVSEALAKLSPNAKAAVEAVHNLRGAWDGLQKNVQDNLFVGLDKAITDLGNKALPGLQVGLSRVASGLNANFRTIGESLGNQQSGTFMQRIFGNTDQALQNLSRGMNPLINGFLRLTSVSSNFLPRLGEAADKVFTRFDKFTEKISTDGSLNRWIDSGLRAMTSLGNTLVNIGSIISSVATAFDKASGHGGGFVKTFEDATKKWAEFLKSDKGQQDLVSYFKQAKELLGDLRGSFTNIKPIIHDVVTAARDWSKILLELASTFATVATWIDKHTGLVKDAVLAYAGFRTAQPIISGLTTVWSKYNSVVEKLATHSSYFSTVSNNLQTFKTGTSNAAGGVENLKNKAVEAGEKIGGAGNVSMLGRIKALGIALGPALFLAAMTAAVGGIEELGKAHRDAAEDARKQKDALDALKDSLDQVTGAAGKGAQDAVARQAQSFNFQGLGKRNLYDDAGKSGIPKELYQAALLPQNQGLRNQLTEKFDAENVRKVEASEEWKKNGKRWQDAGITSLILAKALGNDAASRTKVEAALKKMRDSAPPGGALGQLSLLTPDSWKPDWWKQLDESELRATGHLPKDLTGFVTSIPNGESFSAAAGLRDLSNSLVSGGAAVQQRNQVKNGHGKFSNPAAAAFWGSFGGLNDDSHIAIGDDGNAYIITDRDPGIRPEDGTTIQNAAGQFVTMLSKDRTTADIQKFAYGGFVQGSGGPRDDNILIKASAGEHITNASAVKYYGRSVFDALNSRSLPRFAPGGWPLDPAPKPPAPSPGSPTPIHDTFKQPVVPTPRQEVPIPIPGMQYPKQFETLPEAINMPVPHPLGTVDGLVDAGRRELGGIGSWINRNIASPNMRLSNDDPTVRLGHGLDIKYGKRSGKFPGPDHLDKNANDHLPLPGPQVDWRTGAITKPGYTPWQPQIVSKPPTRANLHFARPGEAPSRAAVPGGKPATTTGTPVPSSPGPGNIPFPVQAGLPPVLTGAVPGGGIPGVPGGIPGVAAGALPGLPGGAPLGPGRFDESGLQVNTIRVLRLMEQLFPQIAGVSGFRQDSLKWHPNGLAVDLMIPGGDTHGGANPEGKALGDQMYAYLNAHKDELGIDYILWQTDSGGNHYNHLHVNTTGGGYPTGSELLTAPQGGIPGIPGLPGMAIPGAPGGSPNLLNAFSKLPGNLQPQAIAGQVGSIALQALGGFFGLDLSYLSDAQQVGNFYLGKLGGKGGDSNDPSSFFSALNGGGGDSDVSGAVSGLMSRYMSGGAGAYGMVNGQFPLDPVTGEPIADIAFNQNLGAAGGKGGGGEQYRPLVRSILQRIGPKFGISSPVAMKKWEDALVRQIATESGGDPHSLNMNDPNGRGGTQTVQGLFNFVPSTFAANNIFGGSISDPSSQIAAAIAYTAQKYGLAADGGPNQIGRGTGFASGGWGEGMALVSPGEYRSSPGATSFWGRGLYDALNAKAIPRSVAQRIPRRANGGWLGRVPRYEGGGWWPFGQQQQTPGPLGTDQPQDSPNGPMSLGIPAPTAAGPSTSPGPGATAPAPDPGGLPGVSDAFANIGGMGAAFGSPSSVGSAQPGAEGGDGADPRATLGAAPTSQEHTLPAIKSGIEGAAGAVGSIAGMAAQMGITAGTMGAGAAGSGMASQGIQAGAQMAGAAISSAVNILSSLGVGTVTAGSTGSASGVPLLPRQPNENTGVRTMNRNHYGDVVVGNMDEYTRTQRRIEAQQSMPYISPFGI